MTEKFEVPEGLSEKDAQALISEKTKAAYALINEAEAIADKYRLSFGFMVSYGMGGSYVGDPEERADDYEYGEYDQESDDGWRPSSRGC
jgi:hypothetical protein